MNTKSQDGEQNTMGVDNASITGALDEAAPETGDLSLPHTDAAGEPSPVDAVVAAVSPGEPDRVDLAESASAAEPEAEVQERIGQSPPDLEPGGIESSDGALLEEEGEEADAEEGAEGAEGEAQGEDLAAGPSGQWYVVHGYSGYENRVKKNLEQRIESMGMQEKIFQVVVPTEEEIEIRGGERRVVERRVFPGYILVEMIMDETSWYVVRNTPGVTGFVGTGNKPTPLSVEEVEKIMKRIEAAEPTIKVSFKVGQQVRLIEGAFADFVGRVDELYPEKGRARVLVAMFGRDTPLEVDLLHLERV